MLPTSFKVLTPPARRLTNSSRLSPLQTATSSWPSGGICGWRPPALRSAILRRHDDLPDCNCWFSFPCFPVYLVYLVYLGSRSSPAGVWQPPERKRSAHGSG